MLISINLKTYQFDLTGGTYLNVEQPEATYNDLKRPTTNKKQPETTHNE